MALTIKSNIPDIDRITSDLKKTLPVIIANTAKNHFLEGFKKGGGQTDDSLSGWAARKKNDKKSRGRAILVKKAHLLGDIDRRKTTFEEIVIGTLDTDYASYLNEGTDKMPKREFLGDSKVLEAKIKKSIETKMKKLYK